METSRAVLRKAGLTCDSKAMTSPPTNAPRAGFTLLELLVVVAIIALLLAILLPAISQAREEAAGAMCAGHLREIGRGVYYYSQDHNGLLPPSRHWTLAVRHYLLDKGAQADEFYVCPSAEAPLTEILAKYGFQLSYATNRQMFGSCSDYEAWLAGAFDYDPRRRYEDIPRALSDFAPHG